MRLADQLSRIGGIRNAYEVLVGKPKGNKTPWKN